MHIISVASLRRDGCARRCKRRRGNCGSHIAFLLFAVGFGNLAPRSWRGWWPIGHAFVVIIDGLRGELPEFADGA